ncbi:hypothetical protein ABEB36_014021 [Hypothenemus hampei]|uniref:Myb-like domain-containing protein n=1 Tax=Hypothenemus hampei TaxID=57062 RepID=A0ABD1E3W8_HYPHA
MVTLDQNNILLQNIHDGFLSYVNFDLATKIFNIEILEEVHEVPEIPETTKNFIRSTWTRNEIKSLIHLYKEYKEKFKSTTIKNDKVWHEIAQKIPNHTWEQCKNKFKYLKSKYVEKKDNMGPRASGDKTIHFEYFQEMDKIFKSSPNIVPVAIASSSRGIQNIPCLETTENKEEMEEDINKEKQGNKIKFLSKEIHEMREEGRNRRHQEKMEVFREFIHALKEMNNSK